jgi:hypothetical protein
MSFSGESSSPQARKDTSTAAADCELGREAAASVGFLHIRLHIRGTAGSFAAFPPAAVFIHRNIFLTTIRRYAAIR